MKTRIARTNIPVGAKSIRPHSEMVSAGNKRGSVATVPWGFRCVDCGTAWGGFEISVGVDLERVSCSNCYSDNVKLTKIRVNIPERLEVGTR